MESGGCIYILTNKHHTVLYIGVTSDLQTRNQERKSKIYPNSFTSKFNCTKLVYYECFHSIEEAIAREKQLKSWKREWKDELIIKTNPEWKDLSNDVLNW